MQETLKDFDVETTAGKKMDDYIFDYVMAKVMTLTDGQPEEISGTAAEAVLDTVIADVSCFTAVDALKPVEAAAIVYVIACVVLDLKPSDVNLEHLTDSVFSEPAYLTA